MLDRVVAINSCYSMFVPGQRIGVAVSGGADSTALLHVLVRLAPRWNLKLEVLHLNHLLRGEESEEDARFVAEMAREMGLTLHSRAVDVRLRGGNLEQAARHARREFFLEFLRNGALDRIATGHTKSDQAETVLFRILRGSGNAGLRGILPVTSEGLVRPLLWVARDEVESWLREQGVRWRNDSSNSDLGYARNRIRHQLLPSLEKDWNPSLEDALCQISLLAQEDEEYWKAVVPQVAGMTLRMHDGAAYFTLDAFRRFPAAVQRRLLRYAVEQVKGDLLELDYRHVNEMRELTAESSGEGRLQVPGVDVLRSMDWLRIARIGSESIETKEFAVRLNLPAEVVVPGWCTRLYLQVPEGDNRYNEGTGEIDWERISSPLELRNWRPGDRIHRVGEAREKSLKELFHEARIPLWNRQKWPIIVDGGRVVWARQFGVDARYAAGPETRKVLRIREEHP